MEKTVVELRMVLDDPEHSAESHEAHQRATHELDRLRVVLRDAGALEQLPPDPNIVDVHRCDPADSLNARSEHEVLAVARDDNHVVVTVHAPVDGSTLHRTLTDLIDDQGNHSLRVELRSPDLIDPVVAASLLRAAAQLEERGGCFELNGGTSELRLAVALIGRDPDEADPDPADLDAAMQHLHRLALALHTVDAGDADALVCVGIDRLNVLTRNLCERAFRDLTIEPRPVDRSSPGANLRVLANDVATPAADPW